jgi:phosphoglycerol transferase MdoB-like AlkP superfamily enzyme
MFPLPRFVRWLLSLAGLSLIVLSLLRLVTWQIFGHGQLSLAQAAPAFWLGLRFDARIVAAVLLPVLLLGQFRFWHALDSQLGRRLWLGLLGGAAAVVLFFYVNDFLHFRYLGQRLNATALGFLEDAKISAGMVWQTYPVIRILLACAVALIAMLWVNAWLHRRAAAAPENPRRRARVTWLVATGLVGLLAVFGRVGQYPLRWSDAFNLRNDFSANLALNPVQSFFSSLAFRDTGYDRAKVLAHYPRLSRYLGVTAPDAATLNFVRDIPARPDAPARRPNVVLVLCESFSAYKSSMWGNPLDTTPYFAELCRDGVFFENCFTPTFGTARGVWATITGVPDVTPVKTASRNPAMVDQHTIINDFTGYRKLYFLGGSTSWANIRGVLTGNIRDLVLREEDSFKSPRIDVWGISDKSLFLEAEAELARQTEPFFAIIQTAGNHRPYTIAPEDLGEFQPIDVPLEKLRAHGFDSLKEFNAFRYTDFSFRKFMTAARRSAYFESTVFIFIGDHGIGGNAGTMFPAAWTEQALTAYHVPLLFYAPKLLPPRRLAAPASMLDVLPTAAGIAGIAYRNSGLGRDLLHRQEIDAGRGNAAFILDHNNKTLGVVQGRHYGYRQLQGDRTGFVWADFNAPPPPAEESTAGLSEHLALADAFHETARYLLLNNRKPRDELSVRRETR